MFDRLKSYYSKAKFAYLIFFQPKKIEETLATNQKIHHTRVSKMSEKQINEYLDFENQKKEMLEIYGVSKVLTSTMDLIATNIESLSIYSKLSLNSFEKEKKQIKKSLDESIEIFDNLTIFKPKSEIVSCRRMPMLKQFESGKNLSYEDYFRNKSDILTKQQKKRIFTALKITP